jgi:hypothetical protein
MSTISNLNNENHAESTGVKRHLRKYGWLGILFFSLKGIGWLVVSLFVARGCM